MVLNYIHWNPDPEIVNIFGFSIRYYSLFFAGGLMLCLPMLSWLYKREKLPAEHLEKLSTYAIIGIVIGARLGHCLFYEPSYYLAHPWEMILPVQFLPGGGIAFTGYRGLASHGGTLGLLIALFFYARKTGHALIDTVDLLAIVAAIPSGFIRLGNFMNSEIIGLPTSKAWSVIFEQVDPIPRHPAQLYEALSYFIIFVIMMSLYLKRRDQLKNGFFFGLILVLVFTARFVIEYVKENQVAFEEGMALNMGQLLSIPYIVIGIGFIIYSRYKTRTKLFLS